MQADFRINNRTYFNSVIPKENQQQVLTDLKAQVSKKFWSEEDSQLDDIEDIKIGDSCSLCQFELITFWMQRDPKTNKRFFSFTYHFIGTAA